IDGGQTTTITATVSGDSGQGVRWTVTCPALITSCGSMAQTRSASGTPDTFRTDPNPSTTLSVVVTATSVRDTTKSKSVSVTVSPVFRSSGSPDVQTATVDVAYSLPILSFLQGGTAPVTCTVITGALPANLSFDAPTVTVMGTATAAAPPVVIGFSCKDAASPPLSLAHTLEVPIQVVRAPQAGSMVVARALHTATALTNGLVLIAGGAAVDIPTATAELYDPVTHVFVLTGDLTKGRKAHTATLL